MTKDIFDCDYTGDLPEVINRQLSFYLTPEIKKLFKEEASNRGLTIDNIIVALYRKSWVIADAVRLRNELNRLTLTGFLYHNITSGTYWLHP